MIEKQILTHKAHSGTQGILWKVLQQKLTHLN